MEATCTRSRMLVVALVVVSLGWPTATVPAWAEDKADPCQRDPGKEGEKPAKPVYANLPAKTATGLILLTHGWNSDPTAWSNELKQKITTALGNNANAWDIVAYDWKDIRDANGRQHGAKTGLWDNKVDDTDEKKFKAALKRADCSRINAEKIGAFLGPKIHALNYAKVHFVGHSAGSWLNDVAADTLKAAGSTAVIRQTFLDTFMPLEGVKDHLGDSAEFAVQYVDARELAEDKPFTNADLINAYNLEITKVDTRKGKFLIGHEWPHLWYRKTAAEPLPDIAYGWGYGRSLERNLNLPAYNDTIDNRQVVKGVRHALPPEQQAKPKNQAPVNPGQSPLDFRGSQTSDTGAAIDQTTGASFTLDTDVTDQEPEAWVEQAVLISSSEPVNLLQFQYEFSGTGQGWLEVRVDDRIVFDADERYGNTFYSPPWAEAVLLGEDLAPGTHTIAFRLDPFSDDPYFQTTSSVEVSDVRLSFADFGAPVDAILLPLLSLSGAVVLTLLLSVAAGILPRHGIRR